MGAHLDVWVAPALELVTKSNRLKGEEDRLLPFLLPLFYAFAIVNPSIESTRGTSPMTVQQPTKERC